MNIQNFKTSIRSYSNFNASIRSDTLINISRFGSDSLHCFYSKSLLQYITENSYWSEWRHYIKATGRQKHSHSPNRVHGKILGLVKSLFAY